MVCNKDLKKRRIGTNGNNAWNVFTFQIGMALIKKKNSNHFFSSDKEEEKKMCCKKARILRKCNLPKNRVCYWRVCSVYNKRYYSRLQNYDYYELAMGAIFSNVSHATWNLIAFFFIIL